MKRLTDIYFKPKSFERWRTGRIYEYLGVKYAQKGVFAFGGLMDKLTGQNKRFNERGISNSYRKLIRDLRDEEGLRKLERFTRFAEALHMSVGLSVAAFGAYFLSQGDLILGSFDEILATSQFYLVVLQRYNRVRIYNLIDKM